MKKLLTLFALCTLFSLSQSCSTHSGETSNGFPGSVTKYQYGNITYLVFKATGSDGGVAVANYTSDSLEYEFLHSPTKTSKYGSDTGTTIRVSSDGRIVQIR